MNQQLSGKTALVTGSTNNIGRAIAEALASAGAHVVISGRDAERGEATAAAIRRAGGRADFVRADLDGSATASRALAEEALAVLGGRLDILVNNAGVYPRHSTASAGDDLFRQIYDVNVSAPFYLVQALAPALVASGDGVVINLGSWVARVGVASSPLYSSSKAAVEALTRAWSAELGPQGVRVNSLSPGVIRPLGSAADADLPSESLMLTSPSGRAGLAEEVGAAAVFLASDAASFVHGTVLDVDGGRLNVFAAA
ncbi:SDR family NAD(P)-dependent oxidoreductase [Herbiconiux daphne]|uniref:SDR family oxidoreductase n=1 Tax=Herbiconiux daphne TaxID=2970914 RepID=A0ABT2H471_9MICO|nr:SDR family oxidoreductase [Herbiconiux daphne]MCS5734739.1 SDR family oxidoreductase [Herbiconiux daphne]